MPRTVAVRLLPGCRGHVPAAELRRVARHVLAAESVAPEVAVEVALADLATVRELNRLYRGKDEPADVLSFGQMDAYASPAPIDDVEMPVFVDSPEETPSLGEVVVCLPYVMQALDISSTLKPVQLTSEQRRAVAGAVVHLEVHGLLHILGYDHEESEEDSARMKAREDDLLAELGYAGAYAHGH